MDAAAAVQSAQQDQPGVQGEVRGLANHPDKLILTRSPEERHRQFVKAKRHHYLVVTLRVLIPILMVMTASLYFLPHLLFTNVKLEVANTQADIDKVVVDRNALKMVNPKIQGYDKKQGAYWVTADYAVQDLSAPHVVTMHKIDARLEHPDKKRSHLTADQGVFDTKSEVLRLSGNIRGRMSGQITVRLQQAVFNMKEKTFESAQPVVAEMLNGRLRADSMYADTNRRILFFKGRVVIDIKSLHRVKKSSEGQGSATPSHTAAQFKPVKADSAENGGTRQ